MTYTVSALTAQPCPMLPNALLKPCRTCTIASQPACKQHSCYLYSLHNMHTLPSCLVCNTQTLWSCPAACGSGRRTRAAASSASSVVPSPPAERAASAASSESSARSSQRSAAAKAACVGAGAAGAACASWAPGAKAAAGHRQTSCRLRGA